MELNVPATMKSSPRLPLLLFLATAVPGFQHPLAAQAPQPKDGDSIGVERPKGLHPGVHHKVQSVPAAEKASASEVRQRLASISKDLRAEGKLPLAERIDDAIRTLARLDDTTERDAELLLLQTRMAAMETQVARLAADLRLIASFTNTAAVPEGLDVLRSVQARQPALFGNAGRIELLRTFDAARPPMQQHSGKAIATAGAYSGTALVDQDPAFMCVFGPYTPLEQGRYVITWRVKFHGPVAEKDVCFLDVAHNAVTVSGRNPDGPECHPGEWVEMSVPLANPATREYEFRFWPHRHPLTLDRIYVFKLHDKPAKSADSPNPPQTH
jgi:hypothetical protein